MVCVWGGGGKWYVKNVCMYVALFPLYSGIITQTARRMRCRESVPIVRETEGHLRMRG